MTSHVAYTVRKQRARHAGAQLPFSLLQSGTLAHETVLPTASVGPHISVTPTEKLSHGHAQRFVPE